MLTEFNKSFIVKSYADKGETFILLCSRSTVDALFFV